MKSALARAARNAGPYMAIALLVPGGLVIAPVLWLWRNRRTKGAGDQPLVA